MKVHYEKLIERNRPDNSVLLKCFYDQDGKYGEFFIIVNPSKKEIVFASKEAHYDVVLTEAFAKAMQEL